MIQQTSLDAYLSIKNSLNERQRQVLNAFLRVNRDLTAKEVSVILDWDINRVTPRLLELRKKGRLLFHTVRRCPLTGHKQRSYRIA